MDAAFTYPVEAYERASWAADFLDLARQLRLNLARVTNRFLLGVLETALVGPFFWILFRGINRDLRHKRRQLSTLELNERNYSNLRRGQDFLSGQLRRLRPLDGVSKDEIGWYAGPMLEFVGQLKSMEAETAAALARFDALTRDGATSEPRTEADLWASRATHYDYRF